MWLQSHPFILASQSPRREALLTQQGLTFTCVPADIDEAVQPAEQAEAYVSRLALEKAKVIAHSHPNTWVIGSDTCIEYANTILGKPTDRADGIAMLTALSGQTHRVFTGVALAHYHHEQLRCEHVVVVAHVTMADISPAQAAAYWATGEPQDKAGCYAIQGIGGAFVAHCKGSYSAIVGLPLVETLSLLHAVGVLHEC